MGPSLCRRAVWADAHDSSVLRSPGDQHECGHEHEHEQDRGQLYERGYEHAHKAQEGHRAVCEALIEAGASPKIKAC